MKLPLHAWGAYALAGLSLGYAMYLKGDYEKKIEDASAIARTAERSAATANDEALRAQAMVTTAAKAADGEFDIVRRRALFDSDRVKLRDCRDELWSERSCKLIK